MQRVPAIIVTEATMAGTHPPWNLIDFAMFHS